MVTTLEDIKQQIEKEYDVFCAQERTNGKADEDIQSFEMWSYEQHAYQRFMYQQLQQTEAREREEIERLQREKKRHDAYLVNQSWKQRIAIALLDKIIGSHNYTHAERKGAILLVKDMLDSTALDGYYNPQSPPAGDRVPF